ncbi:MAG TPA: thermonuclease family protein [Chthoniobacterales bacterium]
MRCLIFLLIFPAIALAAEPQWEKIENCSLVEDGYRDGDSFLVRIAPKTFRVFRLYFVDTPEDSADQRYPERIADQSKYFGVSTTRALQLGDEAATFSSKTLAKAFTVWTCWQKAPGASSRQRYYARISTPQGDLGELLVANGLARIYGKRITLPGGTSSRDYLDKLRAIESKAKAEGEGGWSAR